jgi:hypothetical protein
MIDQIIISKEEVFKIEMDESIKPVIGLILFIIIFIIIIPNVFFKYIITNQNANITLFILLSYMANLDLLATCLSFHDGPFNTKLFSQLYKRTNHFWGFFSKNIISLITLLAVVLIVLIRTEKMKIKFETKMHKMLIIISQLTIILTITFLFPNRYIREFMDVIFKKINITYDNLSYNIKWLIVFLSGIILSILVILLEAKINNEIVHNFIYNFMKYRNTIIKLTEYYKLN